MNYTFVGKNIEVTEAIKDKTIDKLDSRLAKYLNDDINVNVAYTVHKNDQKVEVTMFIPKRTLRAEVSAEDIYAAIDKVVDVLEKQLVKYKSRLKKNSIKYSEELDTYSNSPMMNDLVEIDDSVIRTKKFNPKPMTAEEAIMEMELLGHSFFAFVDAGSDKVNVVYRRKDKAYGLLEPEM